MKKSLLSTNISLYLRNDTKYSYSYSGRLPVSRTWSIEWRHFQWPWTTSNADIKVTPLFDAECIGNGTRYRHTNRDLHALLKGDIWNDLQWLSEIVTAELLVERVFMYLLGSIIQKLRCADKVAIRRWNRRTLRETEYRCGEVLQRRRGSGGNVRLSHLLILLSLCRCLVNKLCG